MPSMRRAAAAASRRPRRVRPARLVPLAVAALAAGMTLAAVTPGRGGPAAAQGKLAAFAAGGRAVLPAYVPMWATPMAEDGSATADLGPAPAGAPLSARVYLAGRDPRGLAAYAAAVSDPGNPMYRHYLTPAGVQRRFGPTRRQLASVEPWLASAGLRITAVTAHYVAVTGTAAQGQTAFGATWHAFQVAGRAQYSPPPGARITAPAQVAPAVLAVVPLESGLPVSAPPAGPEPVPVAPKPCSRYYGQKIATSLPEAYGRPAPYAACGYTPRQLRSAYGVPERLTGTGVTVAIVHQWAYPTAAQDLATFGARHREPLRPGQFTQILPPDLNASCPDGIQAGNARATNEEDLDIEAVHAMAPDAGIVYLGAECDDDFGTLGMLDALTEITDRHLASIVADASGVPVASPGVVAAYEQVYQQGAAEGIGFYTPSGDYGDNAIHTADNQPMPPSYPASDPWVTAVGGTSLAIGAGGAYEWETGWGDDDAPLAAGGTSWAGLPGAFTAGSGGGTSTEFTQPSYQRGIVPASLSRADGSAAAMRVVPDIAADADPATGLAVGVTGIPGPGQPAAYTEFPGAGTSISTPLIAGLQADAQQAAGGPIGFANPLIYARYGSAAFHDITGQPPGAPAEPDAVLSDGTGAGQPLLETFGQDEGLATTPGYDDVTGVGTPAPGYFAAYRST
jgi:subtilase family serine protease